MEVARGGRMCERMGRLGLMTGGQAGTAQAPAYGQYGSRQLVAQRRAARDPWPAVGKLGIPGGHVNGGGASAKRPTRRVSLYSGIAEIEHKSMLHAHICSQLSPRLPTPPGRKQKRGKEEKKKKNWAARAETPCSHSAYQTHLDPHGRGGHSRESWGNGQGIGGGGRPQGGLVEAAAAAIMTAR